MDQETLWKGTRNGHVLLHCGIIAGAFKDQNVSLSFPHPSQQNVNYFSITLAKLLRDIERLEQQQRLWIPSHGKIPSSLIPLEL